MSFIPTERQRQSCWALKQGASPLFPVLPNDAGCEEDFPSTIRTLAEGGVLALSCEQRHRAPPPRPPLPSRKFVFEKKGSINNSHRSIQTPSQREVPAGGCLTLTEGTLAGASTAQLAAITNTRESLRTATPSDTASSDAATCLACAAALRSCVCAAVLFSAFYST